MNMLKDTMNCFFATMGIPGTIKFRLKYRVTIKEIDTFNVVLKRNY